MVGITLSGEISTNNMFQEFQYYGTNGTINTRPPGSEVAMEQYNRTSLALGGVVPINNYNRNVGELLLDNSWDDYYGARRNPVVLATRVDAWNGGGQPYGRKFGCAGAGWVNGSIYVRQTASTYFYCSGAWADYAGGSAVTLNLWSASTMYDARSGFLRDIDTGNITVAASGRDRTVVRARTRATTFEGSGNPTKYEIQVFGGCKGVASTLITDWTLLNLFE